MLGPPAPLLTATSICSPWDPSPAGTPQGLVAFRPRYLLWVCDGARDSAAACASQCIQGGRYCSPDPDGELQKGYSGADVTMVWTQGFPQLAGLTGGLQRVGAGVPGTRQRGSAQRPRAPQAASHLRRGLPRPPLRLTARPGPYPAPAPAPAPR